MNVAALEKIGPFRSILRLYQKYKQYFIYQLKQYLFKVFTKFIIKSIYTNGINHKCGKIRLKWFEVDMDSPLSLMTIVFILAF